MGLRKPPDPKGFTSIPDIIMRDRRLTLIEKVVFSAIRRLQLGASVAYPSQYALSEMTLISRRQIQRAIYQLEELKLIEVHRVPDGANKRHNLYRIVGEFGNLVSAPKTYRKVASL